jgi:hypothetical protein
VAECITQLTLFDHPEKRIDIAFDAPLLSSDGGLLLLRRVEAATRICEKFAAVLPDDRDPDRVVHSRLEQIRQRVFMIAAGYEDCNDADTLRHDPLFKTACDSTPRDAHGLSCQSTLSRLENLVDAETVVRAQRFFEDQYVASLPADTDVVVLDIDSTADETHGQQQLAFFHGFYDHYIYHPLLVFDDEGRLVSFRLRAGNTHAARLARPLLERVIRKIKARLPDCQVVVRADSGFCVPRLLSALEALHAELGDVDYVLGLARNPVLERTAADAKAMAKAIFEAAGRRARVFSEFFYAAQTWEHELWVVAKAEHSRLGENPRFVVSSLSDFPPRLVYRAYCGRGDCENRIKDFKNALAGDRLSCSRFVANAFRLCLHAAAYVLMSALRDRAAEVSPDLGRRQFDTLRLKLLKVGAMVSESVRRIRVRLPAAFPLKHVFAAMLVPAPT